MPCWYCVLQLFESDTDGEGGDMNGFLVQWSRCNEMEARQVPHA